MVERTVVTTMATWALGVQPELVSHGTRPHGRAHSTTVEPITATALARAKRATEGRKKLKGHAEFGTKKSALGPQDSDGAGRSEDGLDDQDGRQRVEDRPPIGSVSFLAPTHRYFSLALVSSFVGINTLRGVLVLERFRFDKFSIWGYQDPHLDSLSSRPRLIPQVTMRLLNLVRACTRSRELRIRHSSLFLF